MNCIKLMFTALLFALPISASENNKTNKKRFTIENKAQGLLVLHSKRWYGIVRPDEKCKVPSKNLKIDYQEGTNVVRIELTPKEEEVVRSGGTLTIEGNRV